MTTRKGYTLIEILIVLALFAILFSIAIPNSSYFNRVKENMELEELRKDLLITRNKAILESQNYYFYFDVVNNQYIIKTGENHKPFKTKVLVSGIRLNKDSNQSNWVFTYKGTTKNAGTIRLSNSRGKIYELTVTPATGRISLKEVN